MNVALIRLSHLQTFNGADAHPRFSEDGGQGLEEQLSTLPHQQLAADDEDTKKDTDEGDDD